MRERDWTVRENNRKRRKAGAARRKARRRWHNQHDAMTAHRMWLKGQASLDRGQEVRG